jgi:hypothetical protein
MELERKPMVSSYWGFAWRISLRFVHLWAGLITLALIGLLMLTNVRPQAVEIVLPLLIGIHAAFVFAPEDEPALELLAAAPRPLTWLLGERLALVAGVQLAAALIGMIMILLAVTPGADALPYLLLGWFAPTVAMMGFSVYASLTMRRFSHGILAAIMLYGGMLLGGDALIARFPFLLPLHLFLRPGFATPEAYLLNRALLIAIGLALLARAFMFVRHEDKVLGL